jgi:prophage maintenance system killer protein
MRFWKSTSNRSSDTAGLRDRVGANAAITFLLMNNWEPTFDEEELVDLVLSVAAGGLSKPRLIEIFESRCKPSEGP